MRKFFASVLILISLTTVYAHPAFAVDFNQFNGRTFVAPFGQCDIHLELAGGNQIATMDVISFETTQKTGNQCVFNQWNFWSCNGRNLVSTCNSNGQCWWPHAKEPSIYLLADGNILVRYLDVGLRKLHPSSKSQYWICQ